MKFRTNISMASAGTRPSLAPGFSRVSAAHCRLETVSTVSRPQPKTVETVLSPFTHAITRLKPGANERDRS
jgi:hypothetical protein